MHQSSKIYVAGHRGLVGSALCRVLQEKGYHNLVTRSHQDLELTDQISVAKFFQQEKPEYVFLAAAKVGGIMANNTYRADFIYENLQIQNNVIHQSYISGVKKLLFLGSTCIYPRQCPQPMKEEYLLTSPLEYTNEPYAIAKIAGLKMCESFNLQYGTNYICVMPTNLYGPGDNFDLEKAHVLPALLRKMHLAKLAEQGDVDAIERDEQRFGLIPDEVLRDLGVKREELTAEALSTQRKDPAQRSLRLSGENPLVSIWGTGKPMREFIWSLDMADACVFIMEKIDFPDLARDHTEVRNTHINIGSGEEISIGELAEMTKEVVGFTGDLVFNTSKPDGTMRKLTDVSKLHDLGWKHKVSLNEGLKIFYEWYNKPVS